MWSQLPGMNIPALLHPVFAAVGLGPLAVILRLTGVHVGAIVVPFGFGPVARCAVSVCRSALRSRAISCGAVGVLATIRFYDIALCVHQRVRPPYWLLNSPDL